LLFGVNQQQTINKRPAAILQNHHRS